MQCAVVRTFGLLVALLCAFAAYPQDGDEVPEADDAVAREAAKQALREGEPSAQERLRVLQIARKERLRAGRTLVRESSLLAASVSASGVWVNVGPTRADVEFNGITYRAQDSGRVRSIVPHPTEPGILYLATAGGGVWKTWDFGRSWEPITDQKLGSTAIGALALDPEAPDILYLGLGDPFDTKQPGLFRSLDGGLSWEGPMLAVATTAGTPATAQSVRDIAVDPLTSAHVFVATDVGLFVWDGASAPRKVALPLPSATTSASMWSVVWAGPGTWLASGQRIDSVRGTPGQGTLGLWRSIDDGQTWTDVLAGLPAGDAPEIFRATLAVAPSTTVSGQTSRVFLLAAGLENGSAFQKDLYRSEDGGKTFVSLGVNSSRAPDNPIDVQQDLDLLQQQAQYNQAIAVDPDDPNTVFIGGMFAAARSQDGGGTWSLIGEWLPAFSRSGLSYVHSDHHAMVFGMAGQKTLYLGTDGGVFASTDATTAEASQVHVSDQLNVGVVSHLAYNLACAKGTPEWAANPGFVVAGLQDNGTRLRNLATPSGSSTFDQVTGGDAIGVAVSRAINGTIPAAVLTSSPLRGPLRSNLGGAPGSFSPFANGLPPPGSPSVPFFIRLASDDAAVDGQTFLTFTDPPDSGVYRSVGGGSWSRISGNQVHSPDGSVGSAFKNYASGTAVFHLLSTHPRAAGVYAVSASHGAIFVTHDSGRTWNGTSVLGTNPQRRLLGIKGATGVAFDPTDPSASRFWVASNNTTLFDATPSLGANPPTEPVPDEYGHLFFTSDGGRTWQSVTGAGTLPNVPVESVKGDPNDPNVLYVGTFIGLYKSTDHGATFTRDFGLPFVKVTDICVSDDGSSIEVATYGRGIWQLNRGAGGVPAGARGKGDLDFDQKLDGFDLLDLVGALGTGNASLSYPPEGDLVGNSNQIDDADLAAFLSRFGGRP
ncbi:MAG: WD40/YVTN/BNR-like repeat-containing protein [Myxococcales bacterium]